ncbi:MAG: class I SAM-dependent methyltransferase [Saprospiraceae bacterium]|nr:class I SAM-dependent methyltransferase [Saprospiraceae bacterium]
MTSIDYIGNELELFKYARNWKLYYCKAIDPFIKGDVCEVGAGLGGTTTALINSKTKTWLAIEPDGQLASQISSEMIGNPHKDKVKVFQGTLADLDQGKLFDTIMYIDVIEHIEKDREEFDLALKRLRPGGHLIILVPAFNFLYNEFDKNIGHFRRYNKPMLNALAKGRQVRKVKLVYYDCLGLFASVVNKLFLKKPVPSARDIRLWDEKLIPVSKLIDPLIFRSFGKSLIGVWQKN